MPSPINSWDELWDKEASKLCEALPSALVGGAPVSIWCFQPAEEEKLVYLNRVLQKADSIPLNEGKNARKIFYEASHSAPWFAKEFSMSLDTVEEYLKLDEGFRKRFYLAETLRYGDENHELYDPTNYLCKVGVRYLMQVVRASPLYHDSDLWWARLPHLGICHTIGDRLGKIGDGEPSKQAGASEHTNASAPLLLICGIAAGSQIMAGRLEILLNNYFKWPREKPEGDDRPESIARKIYAGNIADRDKWDKAVYLVSRLIIAHHMFFPQSPAALQVFKLLNLDVNKDILAPNGWPTWKSIPEPEPSNNNLKTQFAYLTGDLLYLLHSLAKPDSPTQISKEKLNATVEELACVAVALLSGTPTRVEGGYAILYPPRELFSLRKFWLPLYEQGQIDSDRKIVYSCKFDFRRITAKLCPVSEGEEIENLYRKKKPRAPYGKMEEYKVVFGPKGSPERIPYPPEVSGRLIWIGEYMRTRFAGIDFDGLGSRRL